MLAAYVCYVNAVYYANLLMSLIPLPAAEPSSNIMRPSLKRIQSDVTELN